MKFRIIKASDWEFTDHKSFYSVDEIYDYLKKMIRNSGFMILISNEKEDQASVNILH